MAASGNGTYGGMIAVKNATLVKCETPPSMNHRNTIARPTYRAMRSIDVLLLRGDERADGVREYSRPTSCVGRHAHHAVRRDRTRVNKTIWTAPQRRNVAATDSL